MKKYYAVKSGRKQGIYKTWEECKMQVEGYKNAKYKSFESITEAKEYLKEESKENMRIPEIAAYVDGSYEQSINRYSYGCVILKQGNVIERLKGGSNAPEYLEMRNVAGELQGAIEAIKWAVSKGYRSICIYHDYEGVGSWAKGEWKANKIGTQNYVNFIREYENIIDIDFVKVKGHSGDVYNEMADALAKEGLFIDEVEDISQEFEEYLHECKKSKSKINVHYIGSKTPFKEKQLVNFIKEKIRRDACGEIDEISIEIQMNKGIVTCYYKLFGDEHKKIEMKIY